MPDKLTVDIIQWDVRSWSKALEYWETQVDWGSVKTALELGGREGGLSLWMAKKGAHVVCSDLEGVRKTAEPLHKQYNVQESITYQDIDATNIPYENHFDIIAFKSIIGGIGRGNSIENQQKVFDQIHKALKPGGKLLFAENLVASPLHQRLRKRFVNWGSSWRYVTMEEMHGFLKEFSSHQIKTTGVTATFGRNETQRNFFTTMDELVFNHVCPQSWKYISYGVAVK